MRRINIYIDIRQGKMRHLELFSRACPKRRIYVLLYIFNGGEYISMEGNMLHFVLTALRLLAFIKHDRKT